jgi:alpha-beta hydrolase superfamily lysophospholipase
LSNVEQVIFHSEGLEIHGSLWKTDRPEKRAVLFCHGAFETQENWAAFADRLNQEGFIVFTFDFAGHGASQGGRGSVNLRTWAYNIRDALNYLQGRGCSAFSLVGWESGGSAAVLAAAHDMRLACAVIMSAPVYLLPTLAERVVYVLASIVAKLKRVFLHKPLTISRLDEMKRLKTMSDETANEAYFADPRVQEIYNAFPIPEGLDNVWLDITDVAKKVNIPVLVIQGSEDKIIPTNQSQKLHGLLPGRKELKIVEGSGHAVHLDLQKDIIYTMIATWVKANLTDKT